MTPPGNHDEFGLMPGSIVTTADGGVLGTVKEARETSSKVDAEHARDYWLNRDTIASARAGSVLLNFDRDRLEDFQLTDPAILTEGHVDREQIEETLAEGEAEALSDRTQRHLKHQGGRVRGSEHYERPPRPTRGAGGNNP